MALVLTGGDGNARVPPEIPERVSVVLVQRLLEPTQVAVLDRPAQHARLYGSEDEIGVDHQLDVIADGVAHRPDAPGVFPPAPLIDGDHHLEGVVALGDEHLGALDELVAVVLVQTEGDVTRCPVPMPAKELGHRPARLLAVDVP